MNEKHELYPLFKRLCKKYNKPRVINTRDKTIGNVLAIGNPGYGKTSGNRKEIELRYALNHKIFCLYDGGTRMDMAYFTFPSNSPFWLKPKVFMSKGNGIIMGPRKYPVELLYPFSFNLKKVPKLAKVFTIPVSDLTSEDLTALMGSGPSTDSAITAFNNVKYLIDDETTPEDFLNLMATTIAKASKTDGLKLNIHGFKKLKTEVFQPLINEGILSSKKFSYSLDLEESIKNKKISVLVLRHCPERYWGFLVHYFMKHISNALVGIDGSKKVNRKVTICLNEVADLLSADEEKGSSAYSINKMISKIAKQSRTFNIFLLLDTQLPQELPDIKDTMQRIYVYNSSRSAVEKAMEIIGLSARTGSITQDDLILISHLDKGWYYLFDRDNPLTIQKQAWTRSRSWSDGEDFYKIYDEKYGTMEYIKTDEVIESLRLEKKISQSNWMSYREKMSPHKRHKIIDRGEDDENDDLEDDKEEEEIVKPDKPKIKKSSKSKKHTKKSVKSSTNVVKEPQLKVGVEELKVEEPMKLEEPKVEVEVKKQDDWNTPIQSEGDYFEENFNKTLEENKINDSEKYPMDNKYVRLTQFYKKINQVDRRVIRI